MKYSVASKKVLAKAISPRSRFSDKTKNGRVLIIGGNNIFHGAPSLSSNAAYNTIAALRVGAGYVNTYVPKSIATSVRAVSPNIIVRPLSGRIITKADIKMLKRAISSSDCVVIGPGIGRDKKTIGAIKSLIYHLKKSKKNVILDADALYAIGKTKLGKNFAITPNAKEFSEFYKTQIPQSKIKARVDATASVSRELGACVLLKGHQTIISNGKSAIVVNSKSSALATMGTGDVLSGVIAALCARNNDLFLSCIAGAYLHSLIGDKLHQKMGNHIIASDLLAQIPMAIKEFDKNVK